MDPVLSSQSSESSGRRPNTRTHKYDWTLGACVEKAGKYGQWDISQAVWETWTSLHKRTKRDAPGRERCEGGREVGAAETEDPQRGKAAKRRQRNDLGGDNDALMEFILRVMATMERKILNYEIFRGRQGLQTATFPGKKKGRTTRWWSKREKMLTWQ